MNLLDIRKNNLKLTITSALLLLVWQLMQVI